MKAINEKGKTYGLLKVICEEGRCPSGHILWKCKCECGNITYVRGAHLRYKKCPTISCGCYKQKSLFKSGKKNIKYKHGLWKTSIYRKNKRELLKEYIKLLSDEEKQKINNIYKFRDLCTSIFGIQYSVDHIFPLSLGGRHELNNLAVMTLTNNLRKGTKVGWTKQGVTYEIIMKVKNYLT